MSAQAKPGEAPDKVTIEIDGRRLEVPKGSMIIQAADAAGIPIPRFCYHKKLSIAANCRMCLVDVEKAPKPMPACATPVMDGMRVYTRSRRALDAQRGVMEFCSSTILSTVPSAIRVGSASFRIWRWATGVRSPVSPSASGWCRMKTSGRSWPPR